MAWRIYRYTGIPSFWPAESTVYVDLGGGRVQEYIVNSGNVPSLVSDNFAFSQIDWGSINGDITDQADLIAALALKADASSNYIEVETGDFLGQKTFVFIDALDGLLYQAHGNEDEAIGFITADYPAGEIAKVYTNRGKFTSLSGGLIPGSVLYLTDGAEAGPINNSFIIQQVVGVAISTTDFLLAIQASTLNPKPFNTFALQRRQLNY